MDNEQIGQPHTDNYTDSQFSCESKKLNDSILKRKKKKINTQKAKKTGLRGQYKTTCIFSAQMPVTQKQMYLTQHQTNNEGTRKIKVSIVKSKESVLKICTILYCPAVFKYFFITFHV